MSIERQIRLVLWKNYTIRRRRWVCGEILSDGLNCLWVLVTGSLRIDLAIVFILNSGLGTNEKSHVLL